MLKKIIIIVSIVLIAAVLFLYQDWQDFWNSEIKFPPQEFEIHAGESGHSVIKRLHNLNIVSRPGYVKFWLRYFAVSSHFKTGFYQLAGHGSSKQLLTDLLTGKVKTYQITIIPGWTYQQAQKVLVDSKLIQNDIKEAIAAELLPAPDAAEGWFFPDTYQFTKNTKASSILDRGFNIMQQKLETIWLERDVGHSLNNSYELLILASIVEKETALAVEKPIIAGVFLSRLQKRMRLQTDPTVIYGMGESFKGNIRRKDLRTDTPYNTYTRFGLPPTPIALPDEASLYAVAHPQMDGSLYFVADGSGGHVFSKSLSEHNANVRKYQLRKRKLK